MSEIFVWAAAVVIGWLIEPLVTRYDPFYPPDFIQTNND